MREGGEDPEPSWPGVDLAYDLSMSSYQVLYQRLDAVNARIQALTTYATTVSFAAPVIVRTIEDNAHFDSAPFYAGMALFVVVAVAGVISTTLGEITALSPKLLRDNGWLEKQLPGFKKDAVYWAGQHFEKGSKLVNRKGHVATVLTVLFVAETIFLLVWALNEI